MKSTKHSLKTLTTIAGSKSQIDSSHLIIPSALQLCHQSETKKSPQRTVSIMEEKGGKLIVSRQFTAVSVNRGITFQKKRNAQVNSQESLNDLEIANVLEKIFFKKKRYCFQVLKQFYLFPDETQSSIYSLSVYDPLIFKEEIIHSLVKIMETRVITNKIWGFLNLKMMPFLKAAQKIQEKVTEIQQKTIRLQKKVSLEMIKIAAQDVALILQQKSLQCGNEQKQQKPKKSCLNSKLIQEQVRPKTKVEPKKPEPICQSTTRVYTRQEYELKYGKMKQQDENYEPKVVRISASQYAEKRKANNFKQTAIHIHQTQQKIPAINHVHLELKPQVRKQQAFSAKQIRSPNKYNIIHYHERPREISHWISLKGEKKSQKCTLSPSCVNCLPCGNITCCSCEHSACMTENRSICCANRTCCQPTYCQGSYKNEKLNETRVTENFKFINGSKSAKTIYSSYQNPKYELSQLESRIQYLNFLKNLAKEQQMERALE